MSEKDKEIEALKRHIEFLEQRNCTMTALLQKQIKFSVNVAEILFKMDELLEQKQKKIEKLEANFSALEEFYTEDIEVETGILDDSQPPTTGIINGGEGLEENPREIPHHSEVEITENKSSKKSFRKKYLRKKPSTKYDCPVEDCSYTSHWPHRVKRHLAVHQTEKPFQCPKCNYRCKYRSSLQRHIKNDSCIGAWAELQKRNRSRKRQRNSMSDAIIHEADYDEESLVESKKKRKTLG